MNKEQRQKRIKELVFDSGKMSVNELSYRLEVTPEKFVAT